MFSFEKKNAVSNNVSRPDHSALDYRIMKSDFRHEKQDRELKAAAKSIRDLHELVNTMQADMNLMRLELDEARARMGFE